MSPENLHGPTLTRSAVALVLIDVINDLEFPEGDALLTTALPAARVISQLRRRAHEAGVPIIYANDNFGRWQSDFRAQVEHCLSDAVRGRPLAELLAPGPEDYFVLKPRHSAFFSTTLELLLRHLGAETLILVGLAGNMCVLFTASDAYLRELKLIVPRDCTASNTVDDNERALQLMRQVFKANTDSADQLTVSKLKELARPTSGPHATMSNSEH